MHPGAESKLQVSLTERQVLTGNHHQSEHASPQTNGGSGQFGEVCGRTCDGELNFTMRYLAGY